MAKKKKPAKKQASKAKSQTLKAPPARQKAQQAKPTAPAATSDGIAKPAAKLKTAKPATGASASPVKHASGRDARSARTPPPANAAPVAPSNGDGAGGHKAPGPAQKSVRPSGGKSEAKAAGGKRSPENGSSAGPISEAALPLQTFAVEMQRMAKQSIEQTTEVLERLRDAKSVEEVVSLQTTFMQQSFRRYTEFAGRISQLMTSSHASLFQQGQAAMRSFRSIASGM